jgi:G3E family GTPase
MMSYKDDVINDLQLKLNEYEKHNFTLKREVSTKDEKLLQQQNQISLYKELNKTTTQGIHKDNITTPKQKQIIRSYSTNTLSKYNKTKSTQNNTIHTNTNKPKQSKHLNDVVKNSLNRTLNRIERIYGTLDIQHNNDHYYLNKYN